MNEMWAEMSDKQREEYKDYFIAYHNGVAKTGITGKRIKPLTVLPKSVISGFQKALLTQVLFSQWSIRQLLAFANVPLPTELPGTAARFFYHLRRQLKSQQNEGICGSTEQSEVLLDVLNVMLTLKLAPEAVNKSGCKVGFEVGIGLC